MFDYEFSFEALTAAQRGKATLDARGIPVKLRRASAAAAARGCGYALRVMGRDGARVAAALRAAGVSFSGSFRVFSDGRMEAAAL